MSRSFSRLSDGSHQRQNAKAATYMRSSHTTKGAPIEHLEVVSGVSRQHDTGVSDFHVQQPFQTQQQSDLKLAEQSSEMMTSRITHGLPSNKISSQYQYFKSGPVQPLQQRGVGHASDSADADDDNRMPEIIEGKVQSVKSFQQRPQAVDRYSANSKKQQNSSVVRNKPNALQLDKRQTAGAMLALSHARETQVTANVGGLSALPHSTVARRYDTSHRLQTEVPTLNDPQEMAISAFGPSEPNSAFDRKESLYSHHPIKVAFGSKPIKTGPIIQSPSKRISNLYRRRSPIEKTNQNSTSLSDRGSPVAQEASGVHSKITVSHMSNTVNMGTQSIEPRGHFQGTSARMRKAHLEHQKSAQNLQRRIDKWTNKQHNGLNSTAEFSGQRLKKSRSNQHISKQRSTSAPRKKSDEKTSAVIFRTSTALAQKRPDPLMLANRLGKATNPVSGNRTGKSTRMVTLVIDNGSNTSEKAEVITPTGFSQLSKNLRNKNSMSQSRSQATIGVRANQKTSMAAHIMVDRRAVSPSKSKSLLQFRRQSDSDLKPKEADGKLAADNNLLKTLDQDAKNTDLAIKKIIKKGLRTGGKSASNNAASSKVSSSTTGRQTLGLKRPTSRELPQGINNMKSRRATEYVKTTTTPTPALRRAYINHKQIELHTPKPESKTKKRRKQVIEASVDLNDTVKTHKTVEFGGSGDKSTTIGRSVSKANNNDVSSISLGQRSGQRKTLKSAKSGGRVTGTIKTKMDTTTNIPVKPVSANYRTRKDTSEFKSMVSGQLRVKKSRALEVSISKDNKSVMTTKKLKKTPQETARAKFDKVVAAFDFEVFKVMSTGNNENELMRDDFHLFCEFLLLLNLEQYQLDGSEISSLLSGASRREVFLKNLNITQQVNGMRNLIESKLVDYVGFQQRFKLFDEVSEQRKLRKFVQDALNFALLFHGDAIAKSQKHEQSAASGVSQGIVDINLVINNEAKSDGNNVDVIAQNIGNYASARSRQTIGGFVTAEPQLNQLMVLEEPLMNEDQQPCSTPTLQKNIDLTMSETGRKAASRNIAMIGSKANPTVSDQVDRLSAEETGKRQKAKISEYAPELKNTFANKKIESITFNMPSKLSSDLRSNSNTQSKSEINSARLAHQKLGEFATKNPYVLSRLDKQKSIKTTSEINSAAESKQKEYLDGGKSVIDSSAEPVDLINLDLKTITGMQPASATVLPTNESYVKEASMNHQSLNDLLSANTVSAVNAIRIIEETQIKMDTVETGSFVPPQDYNQENVLDEEERPQTPSVIKDSQSGTEGASLNRRSKFERKEQRQAVATIIKSHSKELQNSNVTLEIGGRKISLFDVQNPSDVEEHEVNPFSQTAPADVMFTLQASELKDAELAVTESEQKFRNKYLHVIEHTTDGHTNSQASPQKLFQEASIASSIPTPIDEPPPQPALQPSPIESHFESSAQKNSVPVESAEPEPESFVSNNENDDATQPAEESEALAFDKEDEEHRSSSRLLTTSQIVLQSVNMIELQPNLDDDISQRHSSSRLGFRTQSKTPTRKQKTPSQKSQKVVGGLANEFASVGAKSSHKQNDLNSEMQDYLKQLRDSQNPDAVSSSALTNSNIGVALDQVDIIADLQARSATQNQKNLYEGAMTSQVTEIIEEEPASKASQQGDPQTPLHADQRSFYGRTDRAEIAKSTVSSPVKVEVELSDQAEDDSELTGVNLVNQSVVKKNSVNEKVPVIFRPDQEDIRLAKYAAKGKHDARYAQEAVKLAMEELEDQLEDDPELVPGTFFLSINMCPKSEKEAMMIQARKLESVINEESDEYMSQSFSRSQYSISVHQKSTGRPTVGASPITSNVGRPLKFGGLRVPGAEGRNSNRLSIPESASGRARSNFSVSKDSDQPDQQQVKTPSGSWVFVPYNSVGAKQSNRVGRKTHAFEPQRPSLNSSQEQIVERAEILSQDSGLFVVAEGAEEEQHASTFQDPRNRGSNLMNIQEEAQNAKQKPQNETKPPEFSFTHQTPEFTKNNSSLHGVKMVQPLSPFAISRSPPLVQAVSDQDNHGADVDEGDDGKMVNNVMGSPTKQKIQRSVQSQKILEQKRKINNLAKRYVSGSSSGQKNRSAQMN